MYANISYQLSASDYDAVKAAIDTINEKLPFLVVLESDERKSIFKLGSSIDFVNDTETVVSTFGSVLPGSFDTGEFTKDTTLFKQLHEIRINLESLSEKVKNTYIAVGGETMTASLEIYKYVKVAAPRTPGLQAIADRLGQRFKKSGKKPKASEPSEEQ